MNEQPKTGSTRWLFSIGWAIAGALSLRPFGYLLFGISLLATTAKGDSHSFFVEGSCETRTFSEAEAESSKRSSTFRIHVNGCRSSIMLRTEGDAEDYRHVAVDGDTTYYIAVYQTAVQRMKSEGKPVGENIAGATALKRPVPNLSTYSPAGPLWLAYASACYFKTLGEISPSRNNAPVEIDLASGLGTVGGSDLNQLRVKRQATWAMIQPGGLPQRVVYFEPGYMQSEVTAGGGVIRKKLPPPYADGFTNSSFAVLRQTNFNGFNIPIHAEFRTFWIKSQGATTNDLWTKILFTILATNIGASEVAVRVPPALPGKTLIAEGRFLEARENPKSSWSYMAEGMFPTEESIQKSAGYTGAGKPPRVAEVATRHAVDDNGRWQKWAIRGLIVMLILAPLLFFLCRRTTAGKTETNKHN